MTILRRAWRVVRFILAWTLCAVLGLLLYALAHGWTP